MIKKLSDFLAGLPMTVAAGVFLLLDLIPHLMEEFGGTPVHLSFLPFDPAWVTVVISGIPLLYLAVWRMIHNPGISKISSALLICIAMFAAIAIGDLFAAGEVAFIMAIGALLEEATTNRAKKGLKKLISLAPAKARRLRDGIEETVPAEDIRQGDILRILPGETIPVDGRILSGETSVDQSIMTGESLPVDKGVGEEVFCGTINRFGSIDILATKVGEDSSLQKLIRMVQDAENRQAPMQRIADKAASWLVPVALLIAIFSYVFTWNIITAVTVLVVFCPCALVLATPTAVMAAIGQATKHGVIIKSGEALEKMGKVDTIAFDKTGTLTRGVFRVQEVCPSGCTADELVVMAAAAESGSSHPIGKAVMTCAAGRGVSLPAVWQVRERAGLGLVADTELGEILVGKSALLRQSGVECPEELSRIPETLVTVACNGRYVGYLLLADEPKEDAARAVERLRQAGIRRFSILSGDKTALVEKLALRLGITEAYGDLMPEGKVRHIEDMQARGANVAFVGDGLNDAPVLAVSNVGVAMGGMGSDVAIEAADVILQTDQPSKLAEAIRVARRTQTVVWQNIVGAVGIKLLILALGALGMATLWAAVFADVGVALLAVLNAMRLLIGKKD